MPATGSSSSSSRGSWTSSMPISSHCCWPWREHAGGPVGQRRSGRSSPAPRRPSSATPAPPRRSRPAAAAGSPRRGRGSPARSAPRRRRGLERAPDAEPDDLVLAPADAARAPSKRDRAAVGLGQAGDRRRQRRLARAVRPDQEAQLARVDGRGRGRRRPEAVEDDVAGPRPRSSAAVTPRPSLRALGRPPGRPRSRGPAGRRSAPAAPRRRAADSSPRRSRRRGPRERTPRPR